MTSKFNIDNRELLQRISCGEAVVGIDFGNLIVRELAAFRLAAMDGDPHTDDELSNLLWYSQEATCHSDPNYYCEFQRLATPGLIAGIILELQERRKADSEPVELPLDYLQGHKDGLEWAAQLAEANHPETGDWLYDDPIELAKAIRKGPDMPPVQPVADSEPDRNPVLAYADSYRDMAKQGVESVPIWSVITDLERNIAPLYRHAQPAPVVPDELNTRTANDVMNEHLSWKDYGDAEVFCIAWNACRAAMLAAAPQPQNAPQNIPEIIPGWIPVSEQMPPSRHEVLVGCWWGEKPRWCCKWATYIPGHPDAQSSGWLIPGASWTPTHWMELPAGPKEVKGE